MITIINYGMGNLGSIENMLKKIGCKSVITSKVSDIKNAKKIILPGVGSFDNGMLNIKKLKLLPILNQKVIKEKIPVLGICLGMQLMTSKSQEGKLKGLGWIDAEVKRFDSDAKGLKVPQMGWNTVNIKKKDRLADGLNNQSRFYFVHSYYVVCNKREDVLFETEYGNLFTSGFSHSNIFGVQFHPEKSHKFGLQLLKNFSEIK